MTHGVDRCHNGYTVFIQTLTMTRCPITSQGFLRKTQHVSHRCVAFIIIQELTPCMYLYVYVCEIECIWSSSAIFEIPECRLRNVTFPPTAVVCPILSNPANGVVDLSQGTSLNAVATFSCNVGYKLREGMGRLTCGPEGEWSDTLPMCDGNSFGIHICCT